MNPKNERNAYDALEYSLKKAHNIINRSPVVVFVWQNSENWPVEFVSQNVVKLFEYTLEEFLTGEIQYSEVVHKEDLERVIEEVITNSKKLQVEEFRHKPYRIVTKSGKVKWIDDVTTIIRDEEGNVTHYEGTTSDITNLIITEQKLAFQKRRAEALLELPKAAEQLSEKEFMQRAQELAENLTRSKIAFIHFINDDEETIELVTWSNRTLHKYCNAVYDNHYPVKDAGIWANALREKKPVVVNDYEAFEKKMGLPEGHAHLERFISIPVIENGKVVMLTGVGNKECKYNKTDVETVQLISNETWRIIQRRRAEENVKRSEKRFSALFNSIDDAVFLLPSKTDGFGKFIDVNEVACKRLGYTKKELLDRTPMDIEKPENIEKILKENLIQKVLNTPGSFIESIHITKENKEIPVEISIRSFNFDEQAFLVAVARDISERKENEAIIREKEEIMVAQSRQAAMGDMIAMIAHQWRQPITVITMAVNNLLLDYEIEGKVDKESLFNGTESITEQTRHLSETIDDFRNFFAPNKEMVETQIIDVIKGVENLVGKSLENNGVSLNIKNSSESFIKTFPNELVQVFLNLINNSKDILKEKKITDPQIAIKVEETKEKIIVSVFDNGGGIPKDIISKIGEPYFTTKEQQGTGLGLYMSKIIIEQHMRGKLSWKNSGELACFTIELPK